MILGVVFPKTIGYNGAYCIVVDAWRECVCVALHGSRLSLFQNGGMNNVKNTRHCKGCIAHR